MCARHCGRLHHLQQSLSLEGWEGRKFLFKVTDTEWWAQEWKSPAFSVLNAVCESLLHHIVFDPPTLCCKYLKEKRPKHWRLIYEPQRVESAFCIVFLSSWWAAGQGRHWSGAGDKLWLGLSPSLLPTWTRLADVRQNAHIYHHWSHSGAKGLAAPRAMVLSHSLS